MRLLRSATPATSGDEVRAACQAETWRARFIAGVLAHGLRRSEVRRALDREQSGVSTQDASLAKGVAVRWQRPRRAKTTEEEWQWQVWTFRSILVVPPLRFFGGGGQDLWMAFELRSSFDVLRVVVEVARRARARADRNASVNDRGLGNFSAGRFRVSARSTSRRDLLGLAVLLLGLAE